MLAACVRPVCAACLLAAIVATTLAVPVLAQARPGMATAKPDSSAASAKPDSAPPGELFDRLHFRSIGPAIMSGRIDDIAVSERDPRIFYIAAATGGLWKTTNNGV